MPMNPGRGVRVVVSWFVVLFAAAIPAAAQDRASGRFVVIADFHFDPFADLTADQFQTLAAAPFDEWPRLLTGQAPAAYRRDSPWSLVASSLGDARKREPAPDFVLCPGDFMAHSWQTKYDRLARQPRSKDVQAYRDFTDKAIRLLAVEIRRAWPDAPFYAVLGNDDSYCGDYMIEPDSPFLAMFGEAFGPLMHVDKSGAGNRDFQMTFARGGYYSLLLPNAKRQRLIGLNTIFFSTRYDNACGSSTATPALDHLNWLEATLDAARAAGERVWLLMHIPPGIDSFATHQAKGAPRVSWQPELTAKFLQLVEKHRATIQMAFAGHAHMDDFRILQFGGEPVLLTKIAPAISPIFGNNPGYQVFEYDRESGAIRDYSTWMLPLPATGQTRSAGWQVEYRFRDAYGQREMNAAGIAALARSVLKDGPARQSYLQYYSVSGQPSEIAVSILGCAILNMTPSEFQACQARAADGR